MQSTAALHRPAFSVNRLAAFTALIATFLLGSASGYAVKSFSPSSATPQQRHAGACPAGSHAVVWYTAGTWTCVKS